MDMNTSDQMVTCLDHISRQVTSVMVSEMVMEMVSVMVSESSLDRCLVF